MRVRAVLATHKDARPRGCDTAGRGGGRSAHRRPLAPGIFNAQTFQFSSLPLLRGAGVAIAVVGPLQRRADSSSCGPSFSCSTSEPSPYWPVFRCRTKELITVEDRESAESWKTVLRDLKRRGMRAPVVAMGDGPHGSPGSFEGA